MGCCVVVAVAVADDWTSDGIAWVLTVALSERALSLPVKVVVCRAVEAESWTEGAAVIVVVVSWASSGMPPAKYKSRRTARLQLSERRAFDAAVAARIFCCRISTTDGDESIFTIMDASFFTPKTGFLYFFPFVSE